MNNKIIFSVALIILFGLGVFVGASMTGGNDSQYFVEIGIVKGWNIIAGTMPNEGILSDSEIKASDIKVVWYYAPHLKKYLQVYPEVDNLFSQVDDDVALTSSMWFYSEKEGTLKYSTLEDYMPLDMRELQTDWNFVTMTPDMVDGFSGSCNIEKAYFWDISKMDWVPFPYSNPRDFTWDGDTVFGYGLVVKVSSDCTLGSSSGITPPGLPLNCEDYTYSTCPEGCNKRCLPSVCGGDTCTSDCDGEGSCYS